MTDQSGFESGQLWVDNDPRKQSGHPVPDGDFGG